jgi:hypothetical protein
VAISIGAAASGAADFSAPADSAAGVVITASVVPPFPWAPDSPVPDAASASAALAAGVVIGKVAAATVLGAAVISLIFGSVLGAEFALLVLVFVFVEDPPASGFALLSLDSGWAGVDFGKPLSFVAAGGVAAEAGAADEAAPSVAEGASVV